MFVICCVRGGVGDTVVKSVFAASEGILSRSSSAKGDLAKSVFKPNTLPQLAIKPCRFAGFELFSSLKDQIFESLRWDIVKTSLRRNINIILCNMN